MSRPRSSSGGPICDSGVTPSWASDVARRLHRIGESGGGTGEAVGVTWVCIRIAAGPAATGIGGGQASTPRWVLRRLDDLSHRATDCRPSASGCGHDAEARRSGVACEVLGGSSYHRLMCEGQDSDNPRRCARGVRALVVGGLLAVVAALAGCGSGEVEEGSTGSEETAPDAEKTTSTSDGSAERGSSELCDAFSEISVSWDNLGLEGRSIESLTETIVAVSEEIPEPHSSDLLLATGMILRFSAPEDSEPDLMAEGAAQKRIDEYVVEECGFEVWE